MISFGGYDLGTCGSIVPMAKNCIDSDHCNKVLVTVPGVIKEVQDTRTAKTVDIYPCNGYSHNYILREIVKILPPDLDVTLNGEIYPVWENI